MAPDRGKLRGQSLDDRDRGVLVEVVDDDDLVGRVNFSDDRPDDRLDRFALVEDGHDDRQFRDRHPLASATSSVWRPIKRQAGRKAR